MPDDVTAPAQVDSSRKASGVRTARLVAIVTGLLGAILALATPFLPVQQDAASISWPQNGSLTNVEAPLVSYTPQQLHVSIPCTAVGQLTEKGGALVSTVPTSAGRAEADGLVIKVDAASDGEPARLRAILRDTALLSLPLDDLRSCTGIVVTSDPAGHHRRRRRISPTRRRPSSTATSVHRWSASSPICRAPPAGSTSAPTSTRASRRDPDADQTGGDLT